MNGKTKEPSQILTGYLCKTGERHNIQFYQDKRNKDEEKISYPETRVD